MKTIEPFYAEIGRRIQKLRNNKHLSQEALGLLLDPPVTRASIANIEAGKQRILAHTLVQLAEALRAELTDIIVWKRESKEPARIKRLPINEIAAEMAEKLPLRPNEIRELTAEIEKSTKEGQR